MVLLIAILLNKEADTNNVEAIAKFSALMNMNSIALLLIKAINVNTKASGKNYGSFRNPEGKTGYIPLGDSVYGGFESNLELNSFMVQGNILYPKNYTKLVSFKTSDVTGNGTDTYTIWRPNGQTINETGFKGKRNIINYKALGDICRNGTDQPKLSDSPTINEKCLNFVNFIFFMFFMFFCIYL